MISFLLDGGPFTWAVLALLLCGGLLTLIRAIIARHVDFPGAGLCLSGLLMGLGIVGTVQGWKMAFMAVGAADPAMRLELMQAGVDVGWNPTTLALVGVVALAPIHGIALARSRNRATWVIKGLGWSTGVLAGLTGLLAWAVAIWLSGQLLSVGGVTTGDDAAAIAAMAHAQTIEIGLLVGVFLGMLSALLGLGGGLTLLVSGIISGVRNRKKHLEDEDDDLDY